MNTQPDWRPVAYAPATFVIDTSIPLDWWFRFSHHGYVHDVIKRMISTAVTVPGVWSVQLAEVLRNKERRGEATATQVQRYISNVSSFQILVDDDTPFRAWSDILALASRHRVSVFKAAYLELAQRLSLPLATTDSALTRAATSAGVTIFTP